MTWQYFQWNRSLAALGVAIGACALPTLCLSQGNAAPVDRQTTEQQDSRTEPPLPANMAAATPVVPVLPLNLPLSVDHTARLTLPVRIGGSGPYNFVVDTGAERTVLSRELASQLQLPVSGRARVVAMTGAVETTLVEPGPMHLEHLTLATGQVPTFAHADLGAQGLIGMDSLQNHRLIINFVNGSIDLLPAARTREERALPDFDRDVIVVVARRRHGRLILSQANIGGRRVDIVIDTGAQASVGNLALQRLVRGQSGQRHQVLTPGELRSVTGGTMTVERSTISRIDINGVDFTNLPVAYGDSPAFAELGLARRPALLLGMDALSLFDRVAIDFANRRVIFDLPDGAQAPVQSRLAGWPLRPGG